MKRRSLLTMVPAASALLSLRAAARPIPPEALTPAGFAIAVQCWSFKEFPLWEAIEMAGAAGARAVELFPGQKIGGPLGEAKLDPALPDADIATLLEHAKKHWITPVNFGVTGISPDEAEARKTFEFARKLGLYGITTESIDAIDTLEKLAKEYDLKVCFHNHPKRPFYKLGDPDFVWDAVKERHPNVGICADVGHWASSGLDPLAVVRKVGARVLAFHMKDRELVGQVSRDRPLGTGVLDPVAMLDEVRKHGFAGNVSIEYEHNWKSNLPEIAQCVGYLRGYAKARP